MKGVAGTARPARINTQPKRQDMEPGWERLAALVERYARRGYFPDASYAVFDRERILFRGSCGAARPDTWFDLASLTKLFVSTAVLTLIRRGAMRLDSLVGELLGVGEPGLRDRLGRVRLENLLTHTSGLPAWYPFYTRPEPFWEALPAVLTGEKPLAGMCYSDLNFMLAGRILEKQMGRDLPEALEELGICCPEGPRFLPRGCESREALAAGGKLAISSYGNAVEERMCAERGLFFGGFRDRRLPVIGQANDGNCWYAFGGISGHAGLFAPVAALAALGRFYLNGSGIFSRAMEDGGAGRGLGFELGGLYPRGCGHTGFTGTSLYLSPSNGIGAAILTNRLAFPEPTEPKNLTAFRREAHRCILRQALAP